MKYGLEKENIEKILAVLKSYSKVDEVILVGSRATGNFKNGSDIDFVLKGYNLKLDDLLSLKILLDNLNLAYAFDLLIYDYIEDPDLMEHIKRAGKVFYKS
jgi:predicted nucleotidyltransferase